MGPRAARAAPGALGALRVRGTGAELVKRIDGCAPGRAAVLLEAAAATGDHSAAPRLLALLDDASLAPLRWLLLETLGHLGTVEHAPALRAWIAQNNSILPEEHDAAEVALAALRARRRT